MLKNRATTRQNKGHITFEVVNIFAQLKSAPISINFGLERSKMALQDQQWTLVVQTGLFRSATASIDRWHERRQKVLGRARGKDEDKLRNNPRSIQVQTSHGLCPTTLAYYATPTYTSVWYKNMILFQHEYRLHLLLYNDLILNKQSFGDKFVDHLRLNLFDLTLAWLM